MRFEDVHVPFSFFVSCFPHLAFNDPENPKNPKKSLLTRLCRIYRILRMVLEKVDEGLPVADLELVPGKLGDREMAGVVPGEERPDETEEGN